jgi:hypothetical protein
LGAGVVISAVDHFAEGGELSPIVIVALLLAATLIAGAIWRWRAALTSAATWACIPLAHTANHALNLPDTLNPNTWLSILYLAVFTLGVATAGTGLGVLLNRLRSGSN